uniref:Uncharacterized protein n=1 Tax=viral metagenome TaxID=1070528 RepID=A0A6C0DP97_9ZZZZ
MAQTRKNNIRKRNNRTLRGGAVLGYEKKDFTKELQILVNTCVGNEKKNKDARQKLLQDNLLFAAWVFAIIASKNKLDFPPLGPRSPDKVAYQDKRIRLILQAISEYDKNAQGTTPLQYTLGKWGAAQQAIMNVRTLASKGKRTGKAVANTSTSATKDYTSKENTALLKKPEKKSWLVGY